MDSFRLTRRHVVGNIATLFSGSALGNGLTIITLLLIARHFGAEEYGRYAASLALASVSSILFNLGLDTWLLREGGRQPKELRVSLGSVLVIKVVGGAVWLLLIVMLAPLISQSAFPTDLLRLLAVTVLLDSLFATTLTGFKASLRNNYTSILEAGSDAAWLAVTAALIFAGIQQINTFVYGRGLVLLASLVVAIVFLIKLIGLRARREMTNKALHEAFPYASSEFLAWVAMRGDVIIIGFALGGYAAGIYSPAVGVVNGLFLVPASFYMVMVPVLSNLYANNPSQARTTSRRMVLLLLLTGAILSAGLFILAPLLISFLSESFQESLGIIRILSVILLLKSGSYGMAAILVATGQQSSRMVVQAIVVTLNISLNLLVISRYGISGVAVVYVVTEFILVSGYAWLVYRRRAEPSERRAIPSGWRK